MVKPLLKLLFWPVTLIYLLIVSNSTAFSKETFDLDLSGNYVYSRVQRAATSGAGSSFSVLSDSGYGIALSGDFYLMKKWVVTLDTQYISFNYEASPTRTITKPNIDLFYAGLGTKILLGDVAFYIKGNSKQLILLEDQDSTTHQPVAAPYTTVTGGVILKAISRYYDLVLDLNADFQLSEVQYKDLLLSVTYSLSGGMNLVFGRQNKTAFEKVFLRQILKSEVLYGINIHMDAMEYIHGTNSYNTTNLFGGLFFKFIF